VTTIHTITATCALCGSGSEQTVVASTNYLGAPDLDLRPGGGARTALVYYTTSRCPECGYCAGDIGRKPPQGARDVVRCKAYHSQLDNPSYPPIPNQFLCMALILEGAGQIAEASAACTRAAWIFDDLEREEDAIDCRRRAARLLRIALPGLRRSGKQCFVEALVLCDLQRRSGDFAACIETAREWRFLTPYYELFATALRFELELAKAGDSRLYTMEDAVNCSM
jgi:hypothetical protein